MTKKYILSVSLIHKLLWLLLLTGCTASQLAPVRISKSSTFTLEQPAAFGTVLNETHQVTVQYNGQESEILIQVKIDDKEVVLVAFGLLGNPIFSLRWTGKELESTSLAGQLLPFDPVYILADFQLALWPHPGVPSNMRLKENESARNFFSDGIKVLIINYSPNRKNWQTIEYQQLERKYRLIIKRVP